MAHAIVHPDTVVILTSKDIILTNYPAYITKVVNRNKLDQAYHSQYTSITYTAMVGTWWLIVSTLLAIPQITVLQISQG